MREKGSEVRLGGKGLGACWVLLRSLGTGTGTSTGGEG